MNKKHIDCLDPHQPPEKGLALFRKTDPDTSQIDSKSSLNLIKHHEQLIIECLQTYVKGTSEQIAKYISVQGRPIDGVKIARRMKRLVRAGIVEDSGRRGLTVSNKAAIIWKLSEKE